MRERNSKASHHMLGNLDKLPGSPQLHRWADWAEWLCWTSAALSLSTSDLAEAIESRRQERFSELDDDVEPEARDVALLPDSPDSATFKDSTVRLANDVFRLLEDRLRSFGESYPFEWSRRQLVVREDSPSHHPYLFLLACSTLRYVPDKAKQVDLAARFEWLSVEATRRLLPDRSNVRLFGSNTRRDGHYSGLLIDRVQKLAADLGERFIADRDDFEARDQGDNGLDVVAWVPFSDGLSGFPTILGQCACTPTWVVKQHSSSRDSWKSIMTFSVDTTNYCFIPFDFRKADGSWHAKHQIHNSVLIDRRRFIEILTPAFAAVEPIDDFACLVDLGGLAGELVALRAY